MSTCALMLVAQWSSAGACMQTSVEEDPGNSHSSLGILFSSNRLDDTPTPHTSNVTAFHLELGIA